MRLAYLTEDGRLSVKQGLGHVLKVGGGRIEEHGHLLIIDLLEDEPAIIRHGERSPGLAPCGLKLV